MLVSILMLLLLADEPGRQVDVARATFADAVQMANDGREAEALAAFQRLVAANPNDHQARLWIARLHARMGHPALAEAIYGSVLLEDPQNVEAMLGVADALLARDEAAAAVDLLTRAEDLAPQNDAVLSALGRAHRHAGRPALALAYLERAVALAPTEQHRLRLEGARLSHHHWVETRGFTEQFSGSTPDSRSGDVSVNLRLTDTMRVFGRAEVQRKFRLTEERGGGGLEWRWRPLTTLRGHAVVGPGNRVLAEGDYLGEIERVYRRASWVAGVRHFDFTGARVWVVSPAVAWPVTERLSLAARYALSVTDRSALLSRQTGHSAHVRGAYRWYPRLWVTAAYAAGVEDFEHFSIDRIGDFRANTGSFGARYELPTLTSIVGLYEHQWRKGGLEMGRVTVSLAQRF